MQVLLTIPAPSNPPYLQTFNDPILHSPSSFHNLSLNYKVKPGRLEAVKGGAGIFSAIGRAIEEDEYRKARAEVQRKGFEIEGYSIEGISVGGHETCVIVPELKCAFDIGRCPLRAVHQNFVFITHAHLDHIVCSLSFFIVNLQCRFCALFPF